MARTIIVSNRLPTKARRTADGQLQFTPSEGGLATGLGTIYREHDNVWVGWPGLFVEAAEEQQQVADQLRADSMAPVFLTEDEIRDYYEGFSNETLWPTFHYFPQYAVYDPQFWEAYVAVNDKFCRAVLDLAGPHDTIWVHDYQLLLLPQLLRAARPDATIGFFLHIPFPSVELFQMLPWRRELLTGMLGADLIGFHTFGYVRHFLTAVADQLGYPIQNGVVEAGHRHVWADAFPMGIDYQKYAAAAASEEAQQHERIFREALHDVKTILSVDRLDYTKGIAQRIRAFDLLLQRYPEWRGRVSLIMVVVPSRDQVPQYQALKVEIDELVGRINGQYRSITWNPIQYFYRSLPMDELAGLYRLADVALVTPMRDGMNLVAKEFVASRVHQNGVLILSEQAGAARELADAIILNPTDTARLAQAMHEALTMPEEEQSQRIGAMQALVRRYSVQHWTALFMNRLAYTKLKQETMATTLLNDGDFEQMRAAWEPAASRLLLLDYDGTLMPFNPNPQRVRPDAALLQLLTDLAADPRNRVVIISGRDRRTLQDWLGHLRLDFIAEHGVWLRAHTHDWSLAQPLRADWKQELRPILDIYVRRTAGSFIEEKDYSLVWHYRRADPSLGVERARELVAHLSFLAAGAGLQVMEGNKVIEIKNAGISKGTAAARWLRDYCPEFILAMGDDRTDEDTFSEMPASAWTVKIGGSPRSRARFYLPDPAEARRRLRGLLQAEKIESSAG